MKVDKKIENYQNLIAQNKGFWIGVFNDDELIANMGLFFKDNLGRFQVADTNNIAINIYKKQGFKEEETSYTFQLWEKN